MRFFAFISLFSAFLLGVTVQSGLLKTPPPAKAVPGFLKVYRQHVKNSFEKPENANVLFSFITGDKNGISPKTKKSFKKTNLSFLLSPSGIHLSAVLLFMTFFLKKIKTKRVKKILRLSLISTFLFMPSFASLRRLSILRIIHQVKFLSKFKISLEQIFIMTFGFSFILGDYKNSPLGFIYSFIFLGTFFALRNYSRLVLILGLFSTQLILGLFLGEKVSLLSIPVGMFGSFIFTFLFPILLLFLATFWLVPFNWAEPLIRLFIVCIYYAAKYLNGTFTSSSLFLIAAIWILMMKKNSAGKCASLLVLLFLHTNTAMTPVIFR